MDWHVLELISIILGIIQCCVSCDEADWRKARSLHRPRKLTATQVKRLASMSDISAFKKLLKPILVERVSGTPANKLVQEYIISKLEELKWHVETDTFTDTTPYEDKVFTNIIATHNPDARRRLVLACHFDSKYFKNIKFIGATDSAVPCAMLLDLARLLNSSLWKSYLSGASCPSNDAKCEKTINDPKDDLTLQLIFFDGEEAFKDWTATDSIYGARHLADRYAQTKHHRDKLADTTMIHTLDVILLLDLIGTKGPTFYSWWDNSDGHFKHLVKIEKLLTKNHKGTLKKPHGITPYFQEGRMHFTGIEDDHIPFLRKGVPIVHMIAYPFPEVWHRYTDDEKCLDYDTINDLNIIVRQFVAEYLGLSV